MKILIFDVIKYYSESNKCIVRIENKFYKSFMGIITLISVYDKKRIRFELISSKPTLTCLCPYL